MLGEKEILCHVILQAYLMDRTASRKPWRHRVGDPYDGFTVVIDYQRCVMTMALDCRSVLCDRSSQLIILAGFHFD